MTRATLEEHAWRAGRVAGLLVGLAWVVLSCWLAVDASWTAAGLITMITPLAMLLAFYGVERLAIRRKVDA